MRLREAFFPGARAAGLALLAAAALFGQRQPQTFVEIVDDFSRGSGGWLAGFSDYGLAQGGMDRLAEMRPAPSDDAEERAYYLQGANRSDDLFMFLKKPLTSEDGIVADSEYQVEILVQLYSASPSGCSGIGGAPGESVFLKAGASTVEPVAVLMGEDVRLSVDKGDQSDGGENADVIGNVANGLECTDENIGKYVLIERRHTLSNTVESASNGELWIFVGTDSGFEGTTGLYYTRIVAVLTRLGEASQ